MFEALLAWHLLFGHESAHREAEMFSQPTVQLSEAEMGSLAARNAEPTPRKDCIPGGYLCVGDRVMVRIFLGMDRTGTISGFAVSGQGAIEGVYVFEEKYNNTAWRTPDELQKL